MCSLLEANTSLRRATPAQNEQILVRGILKRKEEVMRRLRIGVVLRLSVIALACSALALSVWAGQASEKTKSSQKATASSTSTTAKVDLNTASEKELDSLPGVGPATAKKIIARRPYSSVDELSRAGVSASTIKKITPLVTVSGGTAASPSAKKSTKEEVPVAQPSPATPSQPTPALQTKAAPPAVSQATAGPGMVWVNLDSGVYHYEGSRYYGKTKNGKYMSEVDAVKAGYHPAKNEKKPQ